MTRLPRSVSGAEVVRALERAGFTVQRQRGSHIIMRGGAMTTFRREAFADAIRARREAEALSLRQVDAGVSASTLSRLERGELPDLETFFLICAWLDIAPGEFFASTNRGPAFSTPERIRWLLWNDPTLPRDVGTALAATVQAIYEQK